MYLINKLALISVGIFFSSMSWALPNLPEQEIAVLNADTTIPFVSFQASLSIQPDTAGTLQNVFVQGNIPGMDQFSGTLAQFEKQPFSVWHGNKIALNMQLGKFDASQGGKFRLIVLLCTGQYVAANFNLVRSPAGSTHWQLFLDKTTQPVSTFTLVARVGLDGWEGCFETAKYH